MSLSRILNGANMSFNDIHQNKILAKNSEGTVLPAMLAILMLNCRNTLEIVIFLVL